jgi:hypothetical protein
VQIENAHPGTVPAAISGAYGENVRTRRTLAALAGLLTLVVAGCGTEAGPTPKPGAANPGPEQLSLKLDALTVDRCFTNPDQESPKGCEKYITEMSNTSRMVRQLAGPRMPTFGPQADRLDKSISVYRDSSCGSVATPGNDPCTNSLIDLASTLRAVKESLKGQATTG